jgi:hypothetical protein
MFINHSVEMKSQQVSLLSILQNSTSTSTSPSLSFIESKNSSYYHHHSNGSFTSSFSNSSTSSSLLSGNSSTSAAQESFIGSSQKCQFNEKCGEGDAKKFIEQNIGDVSYIYNEVEDSEKLLFSNVGSVNGFWEENPLDYVV